jgi:hypothetical protein
MNSGSFIITNSTITGNSADYGTGGGVWNVGTLTVTNSTITGNTAAVYGTLGSGGGGVSNGGCIRFNGCRSGILTFALTLVTGNTVSRGPEMTNPDAGTVLADNHNLFGVNGTAGVEGFTPGATDMVPPAGIQLTDILNPTLANNGGATQTHALVPSSPAIDAGSTDCADVTGTPLTTDQRGRPRVVDGNSDGTAACDIGAVEFFPIVNDRVALDAAPTTTFDATPVVGGPAGTFTITATFTNTSTTPLRFPFFSVSDLTGDNLVLNADGAPGGVGATVIPEVVGDVLAPGASMTAEFVIGLQTRERFTFLVDVLGEPVVDTATRQAARGRGRHPTRHTRR